MSFIDVSKLEYRKNVGMVLINAEGHIFAGKRLDNNTDAWQMPQGVLMKENPKQLLLENYLKKQAYITAKLAF